jgi:ribulose-5-phosphate 4-epimerase/fuculose-1-phosphate aldolase
MYYFNLSLVKRRKIKIDNVLLDKHFLRKHGKNAYYGQR